MHAARSTVSTLVGDCWAARTSSSEYTVCTPRRSRKLSVESISSVESRWRRKHRRICTRLIVSGNPPAVLSRAVGRPACASWTGKRRVGRAGQGELAVCGGWVMSARIRLCEYAPRASLPVARAHRRACFPQRSWRRRPRRGRPNYGRTGCWPFVLLFLDFFSRTRTPHGGVFVPSERPFWNGGPLKEWAPQSRPLRTSPCPPGWTRRWAAGSACARGRSPTAARRAAACHR
mmetsp:Transcript_35711/g.113777  ORF Transcript_35711/g.113777 Transcript_35711/m.113777 type:complete len:232 (-) Transcript_35711:1174-1869(-)